MRAQAGWAEGRCLFPPPSQTSAGPTVCARAGTEQTPPPTLLEFPVQQGGTQTDRGVGQAPLRKAGVLTAVMEGSLPWSCRLHLLAGPAPAWMAVGVGWAGLASGKSIPGVPEGAMCKERPGTDSAPCPPTSSAISSILGTWLQQYLEDFCQPPGFPCVKQLVAHVQLTMPGSDLEHRAHLLLAPLEHAGPPEAEPEGEKAGAGCVPCAGMGQCRPHREDPPEAGVGPGARTGIRAPSRWKAVGETSRGGFLPGCGFSGHPWAVLCLCKGTWKLLSSCSSVSRSSSSASSKNGSRTRASFSTNSPARPRAPGSPSTHPRA